MNFDEAVRTITSVIKEEIGIETSFDHGTAAWSNRSTRIEVAPINDGLKVVIYDDDSSYRELHASLTETDVRATAGAIMHELGRTT